jgi:hypothetical protein
MKTTTDKRGKPYRHFFATLLLILCLAVAACGGAEAPAESTDTPDAAPAQPAAGGSGAAAEPGASGGEGGTDAATPSAAADLGELPGTPTATADAGAQPSEPSGSMPEVTGLEDVDSYRLTMTFGAEPGGDAAGEAATAGTVEMMEEWVREPPARRVVLLHGADMPTFEYVIVGGSAWMKMADTWISIPESEVQDYDQDVTAWLEPDPAMQYEGDEMVNGFHAGHYVQDIEMPTQTMHHELWVVDQPDLPPVVVRMVYRVEIATGEMQTATWGELNVTELNTPITIEPPQ